MENIKITKRDGTPASYSREKISSAISKAMGGTDEELSAKLAGIVEERMILASAYTVEEIQDIVENVLMDNGFHEVAKSYIIYREERSKRRERKQNAVKAIDEIIGLDSSDSDLKRSNANVDGDAPMGIMLQIGAEASKDYYLKHVMARDQREAHLNGEIHIHDLDFYGKTMTCVQIDLEKIFKDGFSTGHGVLREPQSIMSYASLAAIVIQANQNDQHGGQSVPMLDYYLAPGVRKTFEKTYIENLRRLIELNDYYDEDDVNTFIEGNTPSMDRVKQCDFEIAFQHSFPAVFHKEIKWMYERSLKETEKQTYQAMEGFVHNLNTLNSRAGAQVPFSSVNYGTDTSPEGRMLIKQLLLATRAGLGKGETAIFPIQVFKVKEGVNYNPSDPNYDLFKLAMEVSAERLFPNFVFIDAPHNIGYYKEGKPETEVVAMGCRTRVIGNVYDPEREIVTGRGNLSFTTINLPGLALDATKYAEAIPVFWSNLEKAMLLVKEQLTDRFKIQCSKKVKNFPFLMGEGVWIDSEKLESPDDSIAEVLKHGSLSIGFIGLAETVKILTGQHHGESEEAWALGYDIIEKMRKYTDAFAKETGLNFSVLATPAEGTAGRFTKIDREKYGVIEGVTDKDYYTNSFHIPVYYPISAFEKIRKEAPFHALTNAGHITYIELDGAARNNPDAFEAIIRSMKEAGIGYGSINHPVDRDPVCGYSGIIGDECPGCGRKESDGGPGFERIRRITGYLVGTLDRWNNAKRAEEADRVKHGL